MHVLGDDYVLADTANLNVYSLYKCAKIAPNNIQRFPELKFLESQITKDQEKALFYFSGEYEHLMINRSKLNSGVQLIRYLRLRRRTEILEVISLN